MADRLTVEDHDIVLAVLAQAKSEILPLAKLEGAIYAFVRSAQRAGLWHPEQELAEFGHGVWMGFILRGMVEREEVTL